MRRPVASVFRLLAALLLAVLVAAPFAAGLKPLTAAAASNAVTVSSTVQVAFPSSITFKVHAQSDVSVVQLRLHYIVQRQNFASVVSEGWAQFTPGTTVDSQWFWDMRKAPLPPGAQVQYWWTALDAGGKTGQTDRAIVRFDDTRYKWQSITSAPITLYWYNGDASFANALMKAAQDGLKRIVNDVGAIPQRTVRIYVYAGPQDLQSAQLFPPQWQGGVTFGEFDVIAIGVSPDQSDYGLRVVPHELTHWVVGQATFNNYGAGLPTWLDEGLATYGESPQVNPTYAQALQNAIKSNRLISVRSLSSPFSAMASQAYISYGEANSIVTFLIQKYGKDKMVLLLKVFQQGSGYDDALKQVYGFDQDGLNTAWLQSLQVHTSIAGTPVTGTTVTGTPASATNIAWILIVIVGGLLAVLVTMLVVLRRRKSAGPVH